MNTIRLLFLGIINQLFNHAVFYRCIGLLNRHLGIIFTVFATYPIDDELTAKYLSNKRQQDPWKLRLIGVMKQQGRWGLVFGICAQEDEFVGKHSKEALKGLVDQLEYIRLQVGAQQKTFGGILPGLMLRHRLIREAVEADVTADTVVKAINKVMLRHGFNQQTPIIVIGAKGFIGKRVIKRLNYDNIISIDQSGYSENSLPQGIQGKPALLVNISRQYALKGYIPNLWKEVVVLNEVYPEPSKEELRMMEQRDISCYHVVGVEGSIIPPLPGAYAAGVPCCAAIPSASANVVLSEL